MRTIVVATTVMLAWVGAAGAQQETGEVQSARADIHAARTKLVAANLPLTEEEGAKFWPLYNQYRGDVSKLNDRSLALIKDFAASYDSMSDEKASDLLKQQMAIDEDRLKLKKSYLPACAFKLRLTFSSTKYKGIGALARPIRFGRGDVFELAVEFEDFWAATSGK